MGEKAGKRGEREETLKDSKHMSAPGRKGLCAEHPRSENGRTTESPEARPQRVLFHFEVPAMRQHLGHLTTGIKGSRRVPFRQQGAAELVSLLAYPVPQDGSAHRSQPPGRAFLSLVRVPASGKAPGLQS